MLKVAESGLVIVWNGLAQDKNGRQWPDTNAPLVPNMGPQPQTDIQLDK